MVGAIRSWDLLAHPIATICAILLLATSAMAEPIGVASYDSWQWNGFARAAPSGSAATNAVMMPSLMSDAASSPSSSASSFSLLSYLATANSGGSVSADPIASISGYVYLDANDNGIMDTSDWGISGAVIQLSSQGSTDVTIAYSKPDGSYTFTGLAGGTYSVTMLTPCCQPWKLTVGVLQDSSGNSLPPGTATEDQFTDIVMAASDKGTDYNFSDAVYPVAAYSKRLLIDDGGVIHTVPEPGPLVLLTTGGLILGGFLVVRRQAPA
jgi:hypothetical protein